jgi:hypothetical protein
MRSVSPPSLYPTCAIMSQSAPHTLQATGGREAASLPALQVERERERERGWQAGREGGRKAERESERSGGEEGKGILVTPCSTHGITSLGTH